MCKRKQTVLLSKDWTYLRIIYVAAIIMFPQRSGKILVTVFTRVHAPNLNGVQASHYFCCVGRIILDILCYLLSVCFPWLAFVSGLNYFDFCSNLCLDYSLFFLVYYPSCPQIFPETAEWI